MLLPPHLEGWDLQVCTTMLGGSGDHTQGFMLGRETLDLLSHIPARPVLYALCSVILAGAFLCPSCPPFFPWLRLWATTASSAPHLQTSGPSPTARVPQGQSMGGGGCRAYIPV